jgi:hypothetical protein
MRPFEVGDLVKVSYCGENPIWGVVLLKGSQGGIVELSNQGGIVELKSDRFFCENDDFLTIRKPRPGGKEARDIVAMLFREPLNTRRMMHLAYKLNGVKMPYGIINADNDDVYYGLKTAQKAKSMLAQS